MTTAGYDVVFDISQQPFDWMSLAHFAAMPVVGLSVTVFARTQKLRALGALFAATSALLLVGAAGIGGYQWHRLRSAYSNCKFTVTEGMVERFRPDAHGGQQAQTFSVTGHFFAIGPERGPGFNRTVTRGGPDLSNKCVRVAFIDPNEILWLGIRSDGCGL